MLSGLCCRTVRNLTVRFERVRQTYSSKDLITYAATPPDLPHRCILIDVLTTVTLTSSYSALPKAGDYTETFWSCFNVNLSVILMYINSQRQLYIQVLAISRFPYLLLFYFSFLTTCFDPFIRAIFMSTIVQSPLLSVTPITARFAV
jgi:hypothetical protein